MSWNITEIYCGREQERTADGVTTTVTYSGTEADCKGWADEQVIGATYPGLGVLRSVGTSQAGGTIWHATARYQNAGGTSGSSGSEVVPPDYSFGEYSAKMRCQMLSTPLEIHKNASGQYDYLSNWNNYLLARVPKPPAGTDPVAPAEPGWWSTLGANAATGVISPIPAADSEDFQWSESGQIPQEDGYVWMVLKNPTMPGITSYDRALYTQTESARFRTYAEAVASIASKANARGTPEYNPGSPFVNGRWKCDDATVDWSGEYWLATITWTYSEDGWNATLYPNTVS